MMLSALRARSLCCAPDPGSREFTRSYVKRLGHCGNRRHSCAISVALTFTQLIVSWRGTLRHRDRSWNRVTQVYRLTRTSPHLTARAVSEGWWCILCETSDEVRRRSVTVPATQQVQMSVSEFLPPTLFFSLRHFRHFSVTVLKLAVTVFASVPFFDMMTEFT